MKYKNIVHTTGIGDFLAIDAYFTDAEKEKIENIYFINDIGKQNNIKNIIKKSLKYNSNINFISLHDNYLDYWNHRREILYKNNIIKFIDSNNKIRLGTLLNTKIIKINDYVDEVSGNIYDNKSL